MPSNETKMKRKTEISCTSTGDHHTNKFSQFWKIWRLSCSLPRKNLCGPFLSSHVINWFHMLMVLLRAVNLIVLNKAMIKHYKFY